MKHVVLIINKKEPDVGIPALFCVAGCDAYVGVCVGVGGGRSGGRGRGKERGRWWKGLVRSVQLGKGWRLTLC